MVWCSGALSSDQRVLLTQRPWRVCERSWRFHSSRRTWSVARAPRRTTWNGSKAISASGTAARMARWYSPLMSIETALIELLRSPSLVEEALQSGAVATGLAPHDRARGVVGDGGQVAVMAPVADLVYADRDQPLEPALVKVIGDHARDDRADGVPADPQQPGDRRERHLLGQPRHDVFEVARVRRARPRPRDRLQPHAAGRASEPAQLALDPA